MLFFIGHGLSVDTMALNCMEETAYFQGESLKFVVHWLEKNDVLKLLSVFEGVLLSLYCFVCWLQVHFFRGSMKTAGLTFFLKFSFSKFTALQLENV